MSPYSSPIVVVKKKDGTIRLCDDYWQLNVGIRKDAFPLPWIEESLDALAGATLFSTLYSASGNNQASDTEHNAKFIRMPFGLCNAPSTFKCLMEHIFGNEWFHSLLLYLVDIVLFALSFVSHLQCRCSVR